MSVIVDAPALFNANGHLRWNAPIPLEFIGKVCACSPTGDRTGWSRGFVENGERAEWWYCRKCNLPSKFYALYICEGCDRIFYPARDEALPLMRDFAVCSECE